MIYVVGVSLIQLARCLRLPTNQIRQPMEQSASGLKIVQALA